MNKKYQMDNIKNSEQTSLSYKEEKLVDSNKKKPSKFRGILRLGVTPIVIFITALFTVSFSILSNFFPTDTLLKEICDIGFYISMSAILVQVLVQQFFIGEELTVMRDKTETISTITNKTFFITNDIKDDTSSLNDKILLNECICFAGTQADKIINEVLYSNDAAKMKIICYGTSKFGRIIDGIMNSNSLSHIHLDVVICSPYINVLENESDKPLLIQNMKEMIDAANINVYISNTPPTIRASLITDKEGNALCCSFQAYYIYKGELRMFRGEKLTPTIIANADNREILNELKYLFNKEFERLSNTNGEKMSVELYKKYEVRLKNKKKKITSGQDEK